MKELDLYHYIAYISYNGYDFSGFQIQNKENTIQSQIEKILFKLNAKEIIRIQEDEKNKHKLLTRIGFAGRTDAGVHALENIVSFTTYKQFEEERLINIFNYYLPSTIKFNRVKQTNNRINPRFSAVERIYLYIIYNGIKLTPFLSNFVYPYKYKFDIEKLRKGLSIFTGTHNFINFTTSQEERNPIRTIFETSVFENNDFIFIIIRGNSFLHKQVRFMIGSAFMHSLGKISLESLKTRLNIEIGNINSTNNIELKKIKKENEAFEVLPPQGLYLAKVRFADDPPYDLKNLKDINRILKDFLS